MSRDRPFRSVIRARRLDAERAAQIDRLTTENAADLFYSWLLEHGWREPQEHPPGVCQMCEFREAMIDAIKAGQ